MKIAGTTESQINQTYRPPRLFRQPGQGAVICKRMSPFMPTSRPVQRMTRGRSGTPIYVLRRTRKVRVVYWFAFVAAEALLMGMVLFLRYGLGSLPPKPPSTIFVVVLSLFAMALAASVTVVLSDWRFRRHVIAESHQLCPVCGYTLSHLPRQHVCPECGLPYELDTVEHIWTEWVDRWKFKWY